MTAVLMMLLTMTPPWELLCLQRHYGVEPTARGGMWMGRLPDGTLLPLADATPRTFEERLEKPALADMFSIPYVRGPITPVTLENHDPGRIRVERLFEAVYGSSERAVQLTTIRFAGQPVKVHVKVAPAFQRVDVRIKRLLDGDASLGRFVEQLGGTFNWRAIAGTSRRSAHAYGIAMDLDTRQSNYWRWEQKDGPLTWRNRLPQSIVDAFEDEGFIWGGRWYHYDTMHFEYRPELLDPQCAPPASITTP